MQSVITELSAGLKGLDLTQISGEISSSDLLEQSSALQFLAKACSERNLLHPNWGLLAGRLMTKKLYLETPATFSESTLALSQYLDPEYAAFVAANASELNSIVVRERDMNLDYFAISTLQKSYLLLLQDPKDSSKYVHAETPQFMYLRVAVFLWYPKMYRIILTYKELSMWNYTHASPTLFNSGLKRHQLASCYLLEVEDSIDDISKSWRDTAIISMNSGGIGLDFSGLRHSAIGHFGHKSRGIVPWLKIQNEILTAVDQGKRRGSGAIYLAPWHVDIKQFLDMRKNSGPERMRARELFYALWIPDIFMERVEADEIWSLFCPNKTPGLTTTHGDEFKELYLKYEREGKYIEQIKARDLWKDIVLTQIELGTPYVMYKDSVNRKCNQSNLGTIRCSNLCAEITEYTSKEDIASCNLASVSLPNCINYETGLPYFDFSKLEKATASLVRNLNQVIDRNYYPKSVPEIRSTNFKTRPIGIGIQGLADTFAILDLEWESPEARQLNSDISETMYLAAIMESVELAKETGAYECFEGSPASEGYFQFDLWDQEAIQKERGDFSTPVSINEIKEYRAVKQIRHRYGEDVWDYVRREMMHFGLRNSLLIALMPTASSAQIICNNESFEPFTENIYARTVLSGQFVVVNRHMVSDFERRGLWSLPLIKNIISNNGSLKGIDEVLLSGVQTGGASEDARLLVDKMKNKYKTVFEIPQKTLLQMSIDRGRFVCQSQSFNCWMENPNYKQLTAYHFYGWKNGVKTGMYYLRRKALSNPISMGLELTETKREKKAKVECTEEVCVVCQA